MRSKELSGGHDMGDGGNSQEPDLTNADQIPF